ncbi:MULTISPECIES: hypothetical protein [unclassified Pseudoclavibacter]|uniref:hypothetical protein n=1 Tax=unclassified Pseudoclavibacter TaxID=2615177 RepID=UPI001BADC9DF|nr:hypothetical protein [Pseudoclavibacter sp. Marseille-Q4354]MBS3177761.1 hypothetical protein [Pseudoclavibacter sp. Marseille-Q4354]
MPEYRTVVTDAGLDPANVTRVWVQPERESIRMAAGAPAGAITGERVYAIPSSSGTVIFPNLVASPDLRPRGWYLLGATTSNGREMHIWRFWAQPGGGIIRPPEETVLSPGSVLYGFGPDVQGVPGAAVFKDGGSTLKLIVEKGAVMP